ncbi:MAG: cyclic nucleotide-binding domain-containing protein [Bauldia sp.]
MSLERDIELLSGIPLFSDLSGDQLRLIAFSSARRDLDAGQHLFLKGDPALSAFVVASGAIGLATPLAPDAVETCGPGQIIGELALFVESKRRVTATAKEPSGVVEITRQLMRRMLTEYPDVAAKLHARLSDRLLGTVDDLQRVQERLRSIR